MAAPRKMTAHTLEPVKGWPSPSAVDCRAKLSANVTIDPLYAGRVVHLNASGEYETGLPDTIGKGHMPIFLFNNSDDPDVVNDGGDPATEVDVWVPSAPTGYMMGLPAKGSYEFESTEFESEASLSATYAPGDCLTATHANTTAATGGRITRTTNGLAYNKPVCGVVSRGVVTNSHGKSALAFWPMWLPRQA
jgi:hypothetical protein